MAQAEENDARVALEYERLGEINHARGKPDQAEARYRDALRAHGPRADEAGLARTYGHLGDLYAAERMFREALRHDEALGYQPGMVSDYARLGDVYRWQGDLSQAVAMFQRA